MNISELLIPELEHEATITQAFLANLPDDNFAWQPHEKSMTLGQLANHLVEIYRWIPGTMDEDTLQMDDYERVTFDSKAALMEQAEQGLAAALEALQKDNAVYHEIWTMQQGDNIMMQMPRYTALRSMVLPQIPHHRAQLGIYFRLLGIAVPASYGPSADANG